MLVRPDYIEADDSGVIKGIFCKVCGTKIAGMIDKPKGSGLALKFKRFPMYAEAKLRHSDGSFHVTNGCKKCFMKLEYKIGQEIYEADMAEMNMPADRWVEAVVAVDTSGAGLL